MTDGVRILELKTTVYTWCDGCHYSKARKGGHCSSPLVQVNCPISIAREILDLYEQERTARKAAEQREWTRSMRDD